MSNEKTAHEIAPKPGAPENEPDIHTERRALRELIDQLRGQPQSSDDGGFYRNVGRVIARPMMKPRQPGDNNH